MTGPRLVFSTAAFFARPLERSLPLIAECGYAGVEIMVTKDPASQSAERMRTLAEQHGLRIEAIHAPSLLLTRSVWGTDPIGKIERAVRAASEAGVPVIVTHPPYRWQRTYRRWLHEELPGLEDRSGVTVAIENMFPVHRRPAPADAPREPGSRRPRGHPPPRPGHVPRGRREARPRGGPAALRRPPPPRPSVGQRRSRVGLAPPARTGRVAARPVRGRPRRERLRGHDLAGGRPAPLAHRAHAAPTRDGRACASASSVRLAP